MINASGGVAGRRIELITDDDGFDARRTSDNVSKLIREDNVLALTTEESYTSKTSFVCNEPLKRFEE